MKKTSGKWKRICVFVLALVTVLGISLGVGEIMGGFYSFSGILAQTKVNGLFKDLVKEDIESACNKLGCSDNTVYKQAIGHLDDMGLSLQSGKIVWNTVKRKGKIIEGEAVIRVKAIEEEPYWAGDGNDAWTVVNVPVKTRMFQSETNYDIHFAFSIDGDRVLFGDIINISDVDEPETVFDTVPLYLEHLLELLKSNETDSLLNKGELIISKEKPQSITAFLNRVDQGFRQIVNGDYDLACDYFGFSESRSKNSFNHGMNFVEDEKSLKILSASIYEDSFTQDADTMSVKVNLVVQQDKGKFVYDPKVLSERLEEVTTFGYLAEWPIGTYSMDFNVVMKNGAISISPQISEKFGLTAIYLPGKTKNSLTVYSYTEVKNGRTETFFAYDSKAPFMTELWSILRSYDPNSSYAIFWGYGNS